MSSLAKVVASYKAALLPARPRSKAKYRHNLRALASSIANTKSSPGTDRVHYVYLYLDTRKPKSEYRYVCPSGKVLTFPHPPYYVGKGLRDRSQHHLRYARNPELDLSKHNRFKIGLTRKILDARREPKVVVLDNRFTECAALALEIDLIAGIGRRDLRLGPLTNLTDGGDGTTGALRSERTKQQMSRSVTAAWAKKSQKQRSAIYAKVAAANVQTWKSKTVDDNKRRQEKRAATEASRPKLTCPHCEFSNSRAGMMKTFHFGNCKYKGTSAEDMRVKLHGTPEERKALTSRRASEAAKNLPMRKCPHCKFTGSGNTMSRWHFDNCKKRK